MFRIDGVNGKISFVNSSIYRHSKEQTFNIEVIAADSGQPKLTGTCQVVINIGRYCTSVSNHVVPETNMFVMPLVLSLYLGTTSWCSVYLSTMQFMRSACYITTVNIQKFFTVVLFTVLYNIKYVFNLFPYVFRKLLLNPV